MVSASDKLKNEEAVILNSLGLGDAKIGLVGKPKKLTKSDLRRQQGIEYFRANFPAGTTFTTVVNHVSRSGMNRSITILASKDGEVIKLDYWAQLVLDWTTDSKNGGIRCSGCGMDMGFHLVYTLSRYVWKGTTEKDPGYAYKQQWL